MAITVKPLSRSFYVSGIRIADPNPSLPVEEVRNLLSGTYPELNNASYDEAIEGSVRRITFRTAVGTKG